MQPSFLTPAFAQCLGWQRYDPPAALPQLLKVNGLEFYCIGSGGGIGKIALILCNVDDFLLSAT